MMAFPASNSGAQVLSQNESAVPPAPKYLGRRHVQHSAPEGRSAGRPASRP